MSEAPRYVIEINPHTVNVLDTQNEDAIVDTYVRSDRLPLAEAYAARLNERHEMGCTDPTAVPVKTFTPSGFLASLPAYAAEQRRDPVVVELLLADVDRAERAALEMIRIGAVELERAARLRERLTPTASPSESTETAQNASGVGEVTPDYWDALRDAGAWPLFKPGPY